MYYKKGLVEVVRVDNLTEETISFLENTILGIESGVRYQHLKTRERISQIPNLFFFQIKRNNKILGTVGIVEREIKNTDSEIKSFYVRFLSMRNLLGKSKKTSPKQNSKRPSFLDESLNSMFSSLMEDSSSQRSHKLFYAYVEKNNLASQNMCLRNGFVKSGCIFTQLFGRMKPKFYPNISTVNNKDSKFFSELLNFYDNHDFKFFDDIFNVGKVYQAKHDGQVVAGIRAINSSWRIKNIPGLTGLVLMKIIPKIPILKNTISPKEFNFLGFDSIWYKPGYQQQTEKLMEHALADQNLNVGMYWVDENDQLRKVLKECIRPGVIGRLKNNIPADVLIREEDKSPKKYLHYVNALDMI